MNGFYEIFSRLFPKRYSIKKTHGIEDGQIYFKGNHYKAKIDGRNTRWFGWKLYKQMVKKGLINEMYWCKEGNDFVLRKGEWKLKNGRFVFKRNEKKGLVLK